MRSIYDIGSDLEQIKILLTETEGELPDSVETWLANLEQEQAEKLDRYAGLIKTLETEAAQCRKEAYEYIQKAQSRENRVTQLKSRLKEHMQRSGQTRMQSAKMLTFSVVANGGKTPLELDPNIPADDKWYRFEKNLDENLVRKSLESGEKLDFAWLGERGTHLRIK